MSELFLNSTSAFKRPVRIVERVARKTQSLDILSLKKDAKEAVIT